MYFCQANGQQQRQHQFPNIHKFGMLIKISSNFRSETNTIWKFWCGVFAVKFVFFFSSYDNLISVYLKWADHQVINKRKHQFDFYYVEHCNACGQLFTTIIQYKSIKLIFAILISCCNVYWCSVWFRCNAHICCLFCWFHWWLRKIVVSLDFFLFLSLSFRLLDRDFVWGICFSLGSMCQAATKKKHIKIVECLLLKRLFSLCVYLKDRHISVPIKQFENQSL